jgi:hypothetical protein
MGARAVLIAAAVSFTLAAIFAHAASEKPFHCFRPFSQLSAFSPREMRSRDNCAFAPFVTIVDASAAVKCGATTAAGCTVNVSLAMRRYEREGARFAAAAPEVDGLRYTLELRAAGSGAVRYKGFDNAGYSACCALVHEAECEWINDTAADANVSVADADDAASADANAAARAPTQRLVVRRCAVHDAGFAERIVDGRREQPLLHGSVARPLHRVIAGAWEARVDFYRGTTAEGIGRVIVPFVVVDVPPPAADDGGNNATDSEAEAVAVVSPRAA